MKTRYISLVSSLIVTFLLAGCGGNEADTGSSTAEAEAETAAAEMAAAPETATAPPPEGMETAASSLASQLPDEPASVAIDLASGMKEALKVSAERAVEELTGPDGMIRDGAMGVPLPDSIEKLREPLASLGQQDLLNNFSDTLNEAASEALKVAPGVLNETLSGMRLPDVTRLLQGSETAFTDYLESNSRSLLTEKMLPVVTEATRSSGAVKVFEQIKSALEQTNTGGLLSQVGAATGIELPGADFDLQKYVSDEALGRLFDVMAQEERKLRADPAARSSELLQALFSKLPGS